MRRQTVTALLGLSSSAFACSGAGVQEAMRGADGSALLSAIACALLAVFGLVFRLRVATPLALFFLAVHPAWTMSSGSGDCGGAKETLGVLVAIVGMATFAWDLLRNSREKRPRARV